MIETKMIPYFKRKCICDITAADIRAWQNKMLKQNYSPTYLKTINNQMSAMFNYAVRYYDLKDNPCKKAGSIGKSKADEMSFWTKEEFEQFLTAVEHKPDLHEDRDSFKEVIEQVADATGRAPAVIEKDYYVTLILRRLAEELEHRANMSICPSAQDGVDVSAILRVLCDNDFYRERISIQPFRWINILKHSGTLLVSRSSKTFSFPKKRIGTAEIAPS